MTNKKTMKVNLLFEANTELALRNLQNLGKSLNDIATNSQIGFDDSSINKAAQAAQQLQVHLENAVNVDTGKLDLVKLNSSLKIAKTDLKTLTNDLKSIGAEGQSAFIKIATAISSAETPIVKMNKQISEFGKTLLNTAKWQVASTAIHGVSGMLSQAVRHAEDLNEALSDIRIVTGKSAYEMSLFTKKASEAANELNTTTTEYSKAALIFYQQGLSGQEVAERTETVIKLAQVTGQSAKIVSDQMTAIWNNFDNGSKSLEYYADVLTKLGAVTAASTDEISDGLEKFAAVAETIGLEYETAAAAVATVVDKTRQSADVVGTSFKTIFARMQSLSLGETLEDGVTLTKYSEALEKVGVQVLDARGQMRDMDDILDDLGEKWAIMGEESKNAIAQTVGGIRQYNQMMALMNNWTDVEKNIDVAKNAGGELNKQAQIWSESQEAAQQRLKQAQNELYEAFLNNEFLTKLTDIFSALLTGVNNFVDSIGGAGPLIMSFIGLFSKFLFPIIRNGFNNLRQNLDVITGKAQKNINAMQDEMKAAMNADLANPEIEESLKKQIELSQELLEAKRKLAASSKHMNAEERNEAEMRMNIYESLVAETKQRLEKQRAIEEEIKTMSRITQLETKKAMGSSAALSYYESVRAVDLVNVLGTDEEKAAFNKETEDVKEAYAQFDSKADTEKAIKELKDEIKKNRDKITEAKGQVEELTNVSDESMSAYEKIIEAVRQRNGIQVDNIDDAKSGIDEIIKSTEEDIATQEQKLAVLEQVLEIQQKAIKNSAKITDQQKLIVGHSVTNILDSEIESTEEDTEKSKVSRSIMKSAASKIGGFVSSVPQENGPDMSQLSMGVSMESFQNALQTTAEYNAAVIRLDAAQKAYINTEKTLGDLKKASSDADEKAAKTTEKLKSIQNKSSKEYAVALKEDKKAKQEAEKATTAYKTAMDKMFTSYGKTVKNVAASLGLSSDATQEFEDALNAILKSEKINETQLKTLKTAFDNFQTGVNNTADSLSNVADDMGEVLNEGGTSVEVIDKLKAKFQELGIVMGEAAAKTDIAEDALSNLDKPLSVGDKIEAVTTSLSTLAGTITAAYGACQSLVNAFDEGNTPLETTMSLLTSMIALLPLFVPVIKAIADEKTRQNIAETTGNAIQAISDTLHKKKMKNSAETVVATTKETAAEWGNVAAKIAGLLANPVTMGIAAVALAAITASTIAIMANTKAQEANTQAQTESAQAELDKSENIISSADAWLEQKTAMEEALAAQNKLTKGTEEYQKATEKVLNAVPALADSYRDYANAIGTATDKGKQLLDLANKIEGAALSNDVEGVVKTKLEADMAIATSAKTESDNARKNALTIATNNLRNASDVSYKNDSIVRQVGGVSTQTIYDSSGNKLGGEEGVSVNILNSHGIGEKTGDREYQLTLRTDTPENFIKDYEALQEALNEMKETLGDKVSNSDTYREASELLQAATEDYQTVKQAQDEYNKYSATYNATEMVKNKVGDITKIDSLSSYQKYKEELIKAANGNKDIEQQALSLLEEHGATKKYAEAEKKMNYLAGQAGNKSDAEQIKNLVKGSDDKQLDLFLNVDSNIYKTATEIREEMDRLKIEAETDTIKLKIDSTTNALDILKENGMTEEDWEEIRNDENIDWTGLGNSDIKDFSTFINADYDKQKAFLENLKLQQEKELEASLRAEESQLLEMTAKNSGLSAEAKADANKRLKEVQDELKIREKINRENIKNKQREKAENFGLDMEELEIQAKQLAVAYNLSEDAAFELALQNQRMNQGVRDLVDNWDVWKEQLSSTEKGTVHYTRALIGASKAIGNLIGASEDFELPEGFLDIPTNIDLIGEAAKGDIESINKLGIAITEAQIRSKTDGIKWANNMQYFFSQLETMEENTQIGDNYIQGLNNMSKATKLSVDEMNAMLAQLGIVASVTTDEDGNAIIDTSKNEDGTFKKVTFIGNGNMAASTQDFEKKEKEDFSLRYLKIDKDIENQSKELAEAEKLMDSLYGQDRIQQMETINDHLKEEVRLLGLKNAEAISNLETDANAVITAASNAGITITKDQNGEITTDSISTALSTLNTRYETALNSYNTALETATADGIITIAEETNLNTLSKAVDEAADNIKEVKDAWSNYSGTLDIVNKTSEKIVEKSAIILTNNYQKIADSLNENLKENTLNIQEYDYYLNKYSEDVSKMNEGVSLLNSKIISTQSSLTDYSSHLASLRQAYIDGDISEDDYYKDLEKTRDSIYGELEALTSLDQEMMNYYGNTLTKASEEIEKYTSKIDNLTGVLDHYQSLLTLIGKENDFAAIDVVLSGISSTKEDAMEAAESEYDLFAQEAAERKRKYEEALTTDATNEEGIKMYKKQWEDAEAVASEAQNNMLTKTAEWAESMKAVVENKLKGFAKTLEEALVGDYGSFDYMNTSMERASSLQEEYLTNTNQIYEVTKMMNNAQRQMDETSNSVAKAKINAFIQETKQLKEKNKLSKYELEIQQAEYDLVLAQIALEEAQNAKSVVRLQRDAEGNFGYVYTADSNKLAEAEQKVADAQNALYNKQLDGANDYTQKYQQTLSEMYDTMTQLQEQYLTGEIATEEEYNQRLLDAQQYYYSKLTNYSELYQISLSGNSAVAADAWSSDFASMVNNTETWKTKVTDYVSNCSTAFTGWQTVINKVQEKTGSDLTSLSTKVNAITLASNNLLTALTEEDGVIDTLETELSSVKTLTDAYAKQRHEIFQLIIYYEQYAEAIKSAIQAKGTLTSNDTSDNNTTTFNNNAEVKIKTSATKWADGFTISEDDKKSTYYTSNLSEDKKSVKLVDSNQNEKGWIKLSDIELATTMATGGYTGKWGPEGKVAVLHEKEIVLNAQDTENLLAAVDTLRVILNTIDIHSMSAQIGGMLTTPQLAGNAIETLEQNVKIEASFPNVQQSSEIEEAFNSLINRASQYANRYSR